MGLGKHDRHNDGKNGPDKESNSNTNTYFIRNLIHRFYFITHFKNGKEMRNKKTEQNSVIYEMEGVTLFDATFTL